MKDQDFGFYGRGIDGYVHYKQDFDRIQGGGGSHGGSGGPGCLGCLVLAVGIPAMLAVGIPAMLAVLAGFAWVLNQL